MNYELLRGPIHETALIFMGVVYVIRLVWLIRFTPGRERQAPTGRGVNGMRQAIIYSWANIAMPWAMESTRRRFPIYFQFVIFHLGVAFSIAQLFLIAWVWQDNPVPISLALLFQVVIGAAFVVGLLRIVRRINDPYLRAISSPDDHFSLWLLTVWFFFAFFAAINDMHDMLWSLYGFYLLGSFFLVYVPFSKISHYLYYPFTRYYLGKTMGRRGVYPLKRFS